MYGVFIHKEDSNYDDEPDSYYQFPKRLLKFAKSFEGGWVVYYEPTKVKNTRGYYAVARVEKIVPDETVKGHYKAIIADRSYVEFANPVPFKIKGIPIERDVPNPQWAIRPLSHNDFNRILDHGMGQNSLILPRVDSEGENSFMEQQVEFSSDPERKRREYLTNLKVRDRNFRQNVLNAYNNQCAFTGMKFINGGGRAEVQAAHIKPVEANGPDRVRNGIALSGTVHWMFDRGLLSLADNMEIMVSRHINDRDSVDRLIHKNFIATVPDDPRNVPHPVFLDWHRKEVFKR